MRIPELALELQWTLVSVLLFLETFLTANNCTRIVLLSSKGNVSLMHSFENLFFVAEILFTDKARFTIDDNVNFYNTHAWVDINPRAIIKSGVNFNFL